MQSYGIKWTFFLSKYIIKLCSKKFYNNKKKHAVVWYKMDIFIFYTFLNNYAVKLTILTEK
jgi:hypothetical protein